MRAEDVVELLNYVGIVAFALSGALKAGEKDMDLLGFVVLGFSTALAGGIIRDLLLGRVPPVNVVYMPYSLTAIAASLAAFFLYPYVKKVRDYVLYPDAVGLGAFAAIGADLTANYCQLRGLGDCWLTVMMLSSVTAAGGGVVRDVLAGEVPAVLRREIYASAAAVGGLIYLAALGLGREVAMLVTIVAVTAIRIASLARGWELPRIRQGKPRV
ncbi:trimeric intracellular cation channel family protein [Pyrobaculum sp. 3827-6]|uniref:trimeric intracellular cation channel family protein n=1 Tax=Pyrobaculum sp. 3827-6 TaxID=2983604 RepID=UPI0021DB0356|nr:trimeric intracellular cation channel family protein [Pyrobaculum sp. 3827-6]MCU7786615.1 trimeric intracellular cation channel family protein [Pyrobaculum sp. 3827-6]